MKTKTRTPRKTRRRGGSNQPAPVANVPAPIAPVANVPAPNVPVSNVPVPNVPVSNVPVPNASKSSGWLSWLGLGGSKRKGRGKRARKQTQRK